MATNLKKFIVIQIKANGLFYFLRNFKSCMQHCKNQKQVHDSMNDVSHKKAASRYADNVVRSWHE